MSQTAIQLNPEVTQFLTNQPHPLVHEINHLREIILTAHPALSENIKWNGPNFHLQGEDRITMHIHPHKQIQLIFHRGAKPLPLSKDRLIKDSSNLLIWKTNDRAVATFKTMEDIEANRAAVAQIVQQWLKATT